MHGYLRWLVCALGFAMPTRLMTSRRRRRRQHTRTLSGARARAVRNSSAVRMQLAVRVLPTIVCFLDGKAVDRIVGFSEFGARDDFPTWLMAKRLVAAEMIKEAEFEEAWQDDEEAE